MKIYTLLLPFLIAFPIFKLNANLNFTSSLEQTRQDPYIEKRTHLAKSEPLIEKKENKPLAKSTFLGLATTEVPLALAFQFQFPEGFYLLIDHIKEGSPAEKAGVKPLSILKKIDDQVVINQAQLKTLIRSKENGEVVQLTLVVEGKEKLISVTLKQIEIDDGFYWSKKLSSKLDQSMTYFKEFQKKIDDQSTELQKQWSTFAKKNGLEKKNFNPFGWVDKNSQSKNNFNLRGSIIIQKQIADFQLTLTVTEKGRRLLVEEVSGIPVFDHFVNTQKERINLDPQWIEALKNMEEKVQEIQNIHPVE